MQRAVLAGLRAQLAAALPEGTTEQTVMGAENRAIEASQTLRDAVYSSLVSAALLGTDTGRRQTEALMGVGKQDGFGGSLSVDWTLVNAEAREWAREHAGELIVDLNETTARVLRNAIAEWIDNKLSYDDLLREIGDAFGPGRAKRIAETEITRAYAEANRLAWQRGGVITQMIWATANDERVCAICGALDDQVVSVEGGEFTHPGGEGDRARFEGTVYANPPAHPRCRCWLRPEVVR